jgi:hypothetical protein
VSPRLIDPLHVFLLACLDLPEAVLGSSASNLYRTDALRRYPFPTRFGHCGDTGWGLAHAFDLRFAAMPAVVSEFLLHPSGGAMPESESRRILDLLFPLAESVVDGQADRGPSLGAVREALRKLFQARRSLDIAKDTYDRERKGAVPWILRPQAWRARIERNLRRETVERSKVRIRSDAGLFPAKRPG